MEYQTRIEKQIYEAMRRKAELPQILNPKKISNIKTAYDVIKSVFSEKCFSISCQIGEQFPDTGSITVIGNEIRQEDILAMEPAIELCDAFEVTAMLYGKVQLSFTFNDLTDILMKED